MGELTTYAEFNFRRRQKNKTKRRGLLEILENNLVHLEVEEGIESHVRPVDEVAQQRAKAKGTVVEFRTPQRLRPFQR